MDIQFYRYNGERNKINKVLGDPVTISGKIYEMDFFTPEIRDRKSVV